MSFPDSEYLELYKLPRLCMDCIPGDKTDRAQSLKYCDGCVVRDSVADVKDMLEEQDKEEDKQNEWEVLAGWLD